MILNDMDKRRIARDISRHVDAAKANRSPNRTMLLLREFGLVNPTIAIALGLTEGVVSSWATGNKACPPERQAELDVLLREVCGIMLKSEDIPPEAWVVCGFTYRKALDHLKAACVVTPEEKAMLSNAGGYMLTGVPGE